MKANASLQFIGSGDAFGSGGRATTCFHVKGVAANFLIDCGASSLPFMKKYGIEPNQISCILITHFHGDHFGGLPFFLLDAQLVQKRTSPLTIAGPKEIKLRTHEIMEGLFRGSTSIPFTFEINFVEIEGGTPTLINDLSVTILPVVHAPLSDPHGLKVSFEGKIIGYSGDSEWTENLVQLAKNTDMFICECFNYSGELKNHMSYTTLLNKQELLKTKRLILTHMSTEVLDRTDLLIEMAEEGKIINF